MSMLHVLVEGLRHVWASNDSTMVSIVVTLIVFVAIGATMLNSVFHSMRQTKGRFGAIPNPRFTKSMDPHKPENGSMANEVETREGKDWMGF